MTDEELDKVAGGSFWDRVKTDDCWKKDVNRGKRYNYILKDCHRT